MGEMSITGVFKRSCLYERQVVDQGVEVSCHVSSPDSPGGLAASILATSVLAGAVLMLTAAPADAAGSTISFNGSSPLGLPALACNSTPDRTTASLTTADTLNVENLTGRNSAIYLNGSKSGSTVGPNEGVPITFPVGSWTVSLVPDCLLNLSDAGSVKVTVAAPVVAALPAPAIPPASTDPGSSKTGTTITSATTPAGTPRSGSTAPMKPTVAASPSAKKHESKQSPSANAKPAKHGTPGAAPGGTGGNDPFARPSTPTAQAGGPIAGVNIGDARALPAADAVSSGSSYLLVVIAFILVAGVGWAAVRTLFTQRRARRMAAYSRA
jgi:hypothetical protein